MSGLIALSRSIARHRDLALGLTRRELFHPFAGSAFGVAWALLHPLLQTLIYVAVFTTIFQIRLGGVDVPYFDTPTYMIAGLLSWMTWASVLNNGCSTVLNSSNLVKQADFPAEVLPLKTVLAALVQQGVMIGVLLLYAGLRFRDVPWTWALLPVAIALQGLAMLGAAYALGALSVFLRDAKELVAVFTALGVYLTPAFYPPAMLDGMPSALRWAIVLNPFTHFINMFRDCIFWGELRHPWSWLAVAVLALLLSGTSYRAFDRLKIFFGNFV